MRRQYADIDTEPLLSPRDWITPTDLMPWHDPETGTSYHPGEPVQAIFGIEADCPTDSDSHWRMGYAYPIQLTQWALASASQHPVLAEFVTNLQTQLQEISMRHGGSLTSPSAQKELKNYDTLTLTGPAAVTLVVQTWLEKSVGLRWNAVSGLEDGGMSKQVGNVLIFPITGFRFCGAPNLDRPYKNDANHFAVLGEECTVTWAPNRSPIPQHGWSIMRKDRGRSSASRMRLGSSAALFLVSAGIGRKCLQFRRLPLLSLSAHIVSSHLRQRLDPIILGYSPPTFHINIFTARSWIRWQPRILMKTVSPIISSENKLFVNSISHPSIFDLYFFPSPVPHLI
jgi:hypothetical protein